MHVCLPNLDGSPFNQNSGAFEVGEARSEISLESFPNVCFLFSESVGHGVYSQLKVFRYAKWNFWSSGKPSLFTEEKVGDLEALDEGLFL